MNSFVNVQVRILAAQAQRQLSALQAQMSGLGGSFSGANRSAGLFGRTLSGMQLSAFGSRIQWVGRQLEYNLTLPILAAAAASYKLALDNEAAFTRVTKVYGDAAHGAQFYREELDALSKSFVELSNHYGVNQKETIGIAAAWAAAGVSGVALAKSVDLTMQTMILGEMKATDATEALIAIQAQYGLSTSELAKTISILNMVENQTGISLAGLVQGFSRAAGVARGAGVDVRHLAAMLAALTPAAGGAAQAGNALKTIFSRLQSPTKETVEVLSLMGIEFGSAAWKSATLTDQLQILAQKFDGLSDKQKAVVASVVASRWQINKFEILMRELIGTNSYYQRALDATADQTAVYAQMQRELNTVLSSNPRRLQIIWTMLQNAAADIITPMIPLLLYLAEAIKEVVTWFSNLNPSVQKIILMLLFLMAAIGPLIRIGGALVLLLGQLMIGFNLLLKPIGFVASALFSLIKVPIFKFLTLISAGVRAAIVSLSALGPVFVFMMTRIQSAILTGAAFAGVVWRAGFGVLTTLSMGILVSVQSVFRQMMFGIQGIMMAGAAVAGRLWRAFYVGLAAIQNSWAAIMAIQWRKMWTAIVALTAGGMVRVQALFVSFIPRIRAFSLAIMSALTGPWGIAAAIVIVLVLAFWDDLKNAWSVIIRGTIKAWNALPLGIRNAMLAVVRVVNAAVMAVYHAFQWMNPWARHSPSLVENVTSGVAEITSQFNSLRSISSVFEEAGTSLEAFEKAVERVKRAAELKEIAQQREDLAGFAADALPAFDQLVSLLQPLRALLAEIGVQVAAQQSVVDGWKQSLDAANVALQEQEVVLEALKAISEDYQTQLNAAQSELDRFASAPIEGMKQMSDAIFNNQMRQKELRLEMMRMEQALGPLDKLQGRIDSISGELELLHGQQTELRDAGAGSDILRYYDDQIGLLEEQHDAIVAQVAPLQNLSDEIEQLGRQAEMLDLEQSLKFDPLKRQVDDLVNSMQELPFDDIIAGVTRNKSEVDRLTQAYNQANSAVKEQQVAVDRLRAARDAIQASYDLETTKLGKLQDEYSAVETKIRDIEQALRDVAAAAKAASGAGAMSPGAENFLATAGGDFPGVGGVGGLGREGGLEDQSKMIDEFTKEMADKTKNMFGMFNFLDPIKKGWNTAWAWVKDNVGGVIGPIGSAIKGAWDKIGNPFGDMSGWLDTVKGVASGITSAFKTIWELIGPEVIKLGKEAWEGLKDAFKTIQPEIEKFRDLVGPMGDALSNIWTLLKPVLTVVVLLIALVLKALIGALAGGIGPFIRGIADLIGGIIRIFRGIIEVITGVLSGDWSLAWQGVKDIFTGIWDAIYGALKGIVATIWGIVKGFVEGVADFFVWLYNELVGHSIIPDIVNGIIKWWNILYDVGKAIFDAIVNAIKWAWENIIKPVFNAWMDLLGVLKNVVATVFGWIKTAWGEFVDKINWAKTQVGNAFEAIKGIFGSLSTVWQNVVNAISGWISNLVNDFNGLRNRFSFSGIFDGLKSAFTNAMNWVIGKWNNLSFGVGPFKVDTPNIPFLAKGGMVANQATAIVGEGRHGYPEYVIPTDPAYRKRALALFSDLGGQLGLKDIFGKATMLAAFSKSVPDRQSDSIQFLAAGGMLGGSIRRTVRGRNAALVIAADNSVRSLHFHGDLSFPNVHSGADAEEFIKNLEALIGEE